MEFAYAEQYKRQADISLFLSSTDNFQTYIVLLRLGHSKRHLLLIYAKHVYPILTNRPPVFQKTLGSNQRQRVEGATL